MVAGAADLAAEKVRDQVRDRTHSLEERSKKLETRGKKVVKRLRKRLEPRGDGSSGPSRRTQTRRTAGTKNR